MVMQRWAPLRELRQMEDTMNRFWHGLGGLPAFREPSEGWNIPIDVIQKGDDVIIKASLPGVKAGDVSVTVEDNILALRAEKKTEVEEEDAGYLMRESTYGSFYRALRLPETVDTDKIKSSLEDGVLTITMPKAEEKKRKQIEVKVGGGTKTIEAPAKKK